MQQGFQIKEKIIYSDFEYNGVKVFKDVKANDYYIGGIPAGYIVYRSCSDQSDKYENESSNQRRQKL